MLKQSCRFILIGFTTFFLTITSAASGFCAPLKTYQVILRGHRFEPKDVIVQPGARFTLLFHNKNKVAAEFESGALGFEKVAVARSTVKVHVHPLSPGVYKFYNDYDREAVGYVIVKAGGK